MQTVNTDSSASRPDIDRVLTDPTKKVHIQQNNRDSRDMTDVKTEPIRRKSDGVARVNTYIIRRGSRVTWCIRWLPLVSPPATFSNLDARKQR